MNILLLGQYAPELIEALRHGHKIVQVESGPIDRALADAEIIVMRSHLDLTARHIAAAPDLKLIIKAGSGFDNIDMEAARRRGVEVDAAPGGTQAVAEHAVTMLLAAWRETQFMSDELRAGNWGVKYRRIGLNFDRVPLGILGFGRIGRRTAQLASALGFSILIHDHNPNTPEKIITANAVRGTFVPLATLLERSQALSIHLPLSDDTRLLLGGRELSLLPRGAVLVNTARAEIVARGPLIEALRSGAIRSAALDVYHHEPVDRDDELLKLPNVLCTPHIGSQTLDAMNTIAELILARIAEFERCQEEVDETVRRSQIRVGNDNVSFVHD